MFHNWIDDSAVTSYIGNGFNFLHNNMTGSEVVYDSGDSGECSSIYSDRLFQWNPEKYNKLSIKYFGNIGQYWNGRDISDIEGFLGEYLNIQNLILVRVEQGKNYMTGYPYWYFVFKRGNIACDSIN